MGKSREELSRIKYAKYLRSQGRATRVDVAPVRAHLRRLHFFYGMSAGMLAERCALSEGTIAEIIAGERRRSSDGLVYPVKEVYRENAESVMAIQPEIPPDRSGTRVNALGSTRRLQALARVGYPIRWCGHQIGVRGQGFYMTATGARTIVFFSTAYKIKKLYETLEHDQHPEQHGITSQAINLAKFYARRNGYLPPGVWDWETIDDPEAQPDFTGECGTPSGAGIHVRRGILPVCEPCATALREHETALRYARAARKAAEGV